MIEPQRGRPFQAAEIYLNESHHNPLMFVCEHASNILPPGWVWPEADTWLCETHWAMDLGAADLTRSLVDELGGTAVLATFSRLFVDTNRQLDAQTLFRDTGDGKPVLFNQELTPAERQKRLDLCYHPFHNLLGRQCRARPGDHLVSIHSFTPDFEGQSRELEVGVMHVDQDELATAWCERLEAHGLKARVNEPYSGKDGLMYCAQKHSLASGRATIALEFRQDLLLQDFDRMLEITLKCLRETGIVTW